MAEEAKNKASASKFRTSIGGQALIEGVLMRGPGKQAIVVRSPDGLVEKVEELTLVRDKYPVLGLPIIRGAVTFVDSMVKGVKALMFSADYFPDEDVAEPRRSCSFSCCRRFWPALSTRISRARRCTIWSNPSSSL